MCSRISIRWSVRPSVTHRWSYGPCFSSLSFIWKYMVWHHLLKSLVLLFLDAGLYVSPSVRPLRFRQKTRERGGLLLLDLSVRQSLCPSVYQTISQSVTLPWISIKKSIREESHVITSYCNHSISNEDSSLALWALLFIDIIICNWELRHWLYFVVLVAFMLDN